MSNPEALSINSYEVPYGWDAPEFNTPEANAQRLELAQTLGVPAAFFTQEMLQTRVDDISEALLAMRALGAAGEETPGYEQWHLPEDREVVHLMGGGAYTRLLYELTVQFKRFGEAQDDGLLCVHLSEVELGAAAGLSREAVSRELGQLRQKKLITSGYKKICVKDISALEDELGFSV